MMIQSSSVQKFDPKTEKATTIVGDEMHTQNNLGTSQVNVNPNHIPMKSHKSVNPILVCLMGIPFKCRMITPFTTDHSYLGRFARGLVNVSTLFLIWSFSGFIFDVGSSLPMGALWAISIVSCFILG